MLRLIRPALFVLVLAALLVPVAASAHEHRDVGKYQFIVGFLNEPTYTEEQNGISVRITNRETGAVLEKLEGTLKAQVIFGDQQREASDLGGEALDLGDQQREMELQPVFKDPGHYKADFYPTAAGAYTFRFTGTIEGTAVDEQFTSSPTGFDEAHAATDDQFPVRVPSGVELSSQLAAAQSTARTGMILGGAGLVCGLIGLVVALVSLRSRRNSLQQTTAARA